MIIGISFQTGGYQEKAYRPLSIGFFLNHAMRNRGDAYTEFLSVSQFLGVKLGVDFEITPKLRFAGYKGIHDNKKKMLASGSVPIIL